MRKLLFSGLMLLPFTATAANAVTIVPTVTSAPGTTYNTAALTGFMTTSADMIGSLVTITFAGGTTSSAVWTATGASTANWSLSVGGDTFGSPWSLANTGTLAIVGLLFNGVPGNTAFDIVNGSDGSPGSANGLPISSVDGPAGLTVAALYSNRLTVGGVFYDDLYTQMTLTLGGGGLTRGSTLTYVTDTDNALASRGGITLGVPEPATWAMMMLGFGGMGYALRRRPRVGARVRFA